MAGTFGNCQSKYKSGPICYVNEPSNCTDLAFSNSQKRRYSWEACLMSLNCKFFIGHAIGVLCKYLIEIWKPIVVLS